MLDLERMIGEKIISELDLSEHRETIAKAVKKYFGSRCFAEALTEALADQDIATEVASVVSEKLIDGIKNKLTVTIG